MAADKIIITISGFLLMVLTYWFFLSKKEKAVKVKNSVNILVKGGYNPAKISVPLGKPITINFLRKDESTCLEEVVLSDFKIKKYLPINKTVSIEINPTKKGEFDISCGMGMFHGKLVVE